ncbi:MAG: guanylate kinase, partial [Pseudomonadota bacterium]
MSNNPQLPHAMPAVQRRGILLVISSPSGAGKTTLARRLLEDDDDIHLSVSVTTRPARPGEIDGKDYHFATMAAFEDMRDSGALLEWATVFDNCYGTPRADVQNALDQGQDLLFDIDWQGAQQLAEKMGHDVVRVFILPPSAKALGERLAARNQDSPKVVAGRMAKASAEIDHWAEYDYVIVNADVEDSLDKLKAIIAAERARGPIAVVKDGCPFQQ